jgi:hypothetical protein
MDDIVAPGGSDSDALYMGFSAELAGISCYCEAEVDGWKMIGVVRARSWKVWMSLSSSSKCHFLPAAGNKRTATVGEPVWGNAPRVGPWRHHDEAEHGLRNKLQVGQEESVAA